MFLRLSQWLLRHQTGLGMRTAICCASKSTSSTNKGKIMKGSHSVTPCGNDFSDLKCSPNVTSHTETNSLPSPQTPEGQLLRERVKWFRHVIPSVSLEVLENLREDAAHGASFPERGHLLILDDWEMFANRSGSIPDNSGKFWKITTASMEWVKTTVDQFYNDQKDEHKSNKEEHSLVILIPSQLSHLAAIEEQLVLEQYFEAKYKNAGAKAGKMPHVWVMNSEETWRWRKSLLDGSVCSSWPLRLPTPSGLSSPRALLDLPPIPHEMLNHIMPNVSLTDISTILNSSNIALPSLGHLLVLYGLNNIPTEEEATCLLSQVQAAVQSFLASNKAALLVVLVLSNLTEKQAGALQEALQNQIKPLDSQGKESLSESAIVCVLHREQKERVTRAFHSGRVGSSWVQLQRSEAIPARENIQSATPDTQPAMGGAPPSYAPSPEAMAKELATESGQKGKDSSPMWLPDGLVDINGHPLTTFQISTLPCHGEVETLWASAPGCPISVNSLKDMLQPCTFAQLQDSLHQCQWRPPRLHVLACHAGAEQLEQNTDSMLSDILQTAADYLKALTGEDFLRVALEASSNVEDVISFEEARDDDGKEGGLNEGEPATNNSLCDARYVKLSILLYTDLMVASELSLLRALLRSLYNQLPEEVKNVILTLEVVQSEVGEQAEAPIDEKCGVSRSSGFCGATHECVHSFRDHGEPGKKVSKEVLSAALEASVQFLKMLHERESSIRAELISASTTSFSSNPSISPDKNLFKEDLKSMLESAVGEVISRHENAMSHLVETMSKMAGSWSSDALVDELQASIKQVMEPLQEHFSEASTTSAKFRQIILTEDLGKQILSQLNDLKDHISSMKRVKALPSSLDPSDTTALPLPPLPNSSSTAPEIHPPLFEVKKDVVSAIDKATSEKVSNSESISVEEQDSPTPQSSESSLSKSTTFSTKEIDLLTRTAEQEVRSEDKRTREDAVAWLRAKKKLVHDNSNLFCVTLDKADIETGSTADKRMEEIVVRLLECTSTSKDSSSSHSIVSTVPASTPESDSKKPNAEKNVPKALKEIQQKEKERTPKKCFVQPNTLFTRGELRFLTHAAQQHVNSSQSEIKKAAKAWLDAEKCRSPANPSLYYVVLDGEATGTPTEKDAALQSVVIRLIGVGVAHGRLGVKPRSLKRMRKKSKKYRSDARNSSNTSGAVGLAVDGEIQSKSVSSSMSSKTSLSPLKKPIFKPNTLFTRGELRFLTHAAQQHVNSSQSEIKKAAKAWLDAEKCRSSANPSLYYVVLDGEATGTPTEKDAALQSVVIRLIGVGVASPVSGVRKRTPKKK